MEAIKNRYEFVFYFDVEDGNPNGDPDAGNMPRIDPETGRGIVTDVCLKRKIRDYVDMVKEGADGYRLYVRKGATLNANDDEAIDALGLKEVKTVKKKDPEADKKIVDWMCRTFFDIRTFGAVMTTFTQGGFNCGQLRGPVQLGFAKSVDPIMPREIAITRVTPTKEEDNKNNEMGRKFIVPYGLYRCEGYISANLARKSTGFSDEDLQLLWEAIENMFEYDRSAARGKMVLRKLVIFKHDNELGHAPAHRLFEAVRAEHTYDSDRAPVSFDDYNVVVDESSIPEGVEVTVIDK